MCCGTRGESAGWLVGVFVRVDFGACEQQSPNGTHNMDVVVV